MSVLLNHSFYVQVKVKASICDGKIHLTRLMDLMDARACKAGGVYKQCLVSIDSLVLSLHEDGVYLVPALEASLSSKGCL